MYTVYIYIHTHIYKQKNTCVCLISFSNILPWAMPLSTSPGGVITYSRSSTPATIAASRPERDFVRKKARRNVQQEPEGTGCETGALYFRKAMVRWRKYLFYNDQ